MRAIILLFIEKSDYICELMKRTSRASDEEVSNFSRFEKWLLKPYFKQSRAQRRRAVRKFLVGKFGVFV